ncbi:MAG: CRISPR-associated helicase Cas3' [Methylococcales bacterium]|nr:CRISPR-associated helicase Cas3' [Methylococcales bacterium]
MIKKDIKKLGWAKTDENGNPGLSVFEHCRHVGWVASALVESGKLIPADLSPMAAAIIAAIHDVGKWSPDFLHKCMVWLEQQGLRLEAERYAWKSYDQRHEAISQFSIKLLLQLRSFSSSEATAWSMVAGAHHGRMHRSEKLDKNNLAQYVDSWEETRSGIITALEQEFTVIPQIGLDKSNAMTFWLMGLTSVADWIGSDEHYFPIDKGLNSTESQEAAKLAVESIGLSQPAIIKNLTFKDLFGFSPNDMQIGAMAVINKPGIYVIEAPMGLGKTEAALACAYQLISSQQASGIYFALPTQLTSNRIHERVDEFVRSIATDSPPTRLAHANAWLEESYYQPRPVRTLLNERNSDATTSRDWFASAKRGLLANFGVGTVDQALMGVVAVKHFFVRRFALAGKVVIIDEVHSYDHFTGTLINCLCRELLALGCTVIILSATLLPKVRNKLLEVEENDIAATDYPLITGKTTTGEIIPPMSSLPKPRPKVLVELKTTEQLFKDAIEMAQKGARVLWVCNTVKMAQAVYQQLKDPKNELEIGLLHSRFPHFVRQRQEEYWMNRLGKTGSQIGGCILVSTQIVEQSVDIDADILISELAPSDMLLQRIGRLWRHLEVRLPSMRPIPEPEFWLQQEEKSLDELKQLSALKIKQTLGDKARIYSPYVLLKSYQAFITHKEINLADESGNTDIRNILSATYEDNDDEPEAWQELAGDLKGTEYAETKLALSNTLLFAKLALDDEEGKQTRLIEIETLPLLIAQEISASKITLLDGAVIPLPIDKFNIQDARAIHRNIVRVHAWPFQQSPKDSPLSFYLKGQHCLALHCPETNSLTIAGLKSGLTLTWSAEMGVIQTYTKGGVDESCD